MKRYYIAYGSNLNVRQMKFRCPTAKVVGTSVIKGYELLYKGSKTGSYLTIEKKKGGVVPVAVWEVTARDEKSLDAYEGYPEHENQAFRNRKNAGRLCVHHARRTQPWHSVTELHQHLPIRIYDFRIRFQVSG